MQVKQSEDARKGDGRNDDSDDRGQRGGRGPNGLGGCKRTFKEGMRGRGDFGPMNMAATNLAARAFVMGFRTTDPFKN